jgi:hypothetical protein
MKKEDIIAELKAKLDNTLDVDLKMLIQQKIDSIQNDNTVMK